MLLALAMFVFGCSQPTTTPNQSEKEDVEKAVELTAAPETTARAVPEHAASEQSSTASAKSAAQEAEMEAQEGMEETGLQPTSALYATKSGARRRKHVSTRKRKPERRASRQFRNARPAKTPKGNSHVRGN
jgi:hypothetical protein